MKSLGVTKILKQIKFEGAWKQKTILRQSWTKDLRQTLGSFLVALTTFSLWEEDSALDSNSMKFSEFLIFSNSRFS